MARTKKTKVDPMDLFLREAAFLGMTYGQFQGMCYEKYPDSTRPMMQYVNDPDVPHPKDVDRSMIPTDYAAGPVVIVQNGKPAAPLPVEDVECKWCGCSFKQSVNYRKYCSDECRRSVDAYKKRITHRKWTIARAVEKGADKAKYAEELEMLDAGIVPGLPAKKHPIAIARTIGGGVNA